MAWISSSQPLHEPASTWRIVRARPSVRRMCCCRRATCTISSAGDGAGSVLIPIFAIWRSMVHMALARLQVVAAVGKVERFVDQRKIGDDVADDRMLQHRPVLPRRVVRVTATDDAIGSAFQADRNRPAPAL